MRDQNWFHYESEQKRKVFYLLLEKPWLHANGTTRDLPYHQPKELEKLVTVQTPSAWRIESFLIEEFQK